MFHHLGNVKLSLAAKCELCFGVAVVLVIAAAVFFPWLRMEQLTGQLNESVANAIIQTALEEHLDYWKDHKTEAEARIALRGKAGKIPDTTTRPTTEPIGEEPLTFGPPKLLLLKDYSEQCTDLERRTMAHFRRHPELDRFWKLKRTEDSGYSFRYGRLLYREDRCKECHGSAEEAGPQAGSFAMATVQIPSQVEPNDLLKNRMFIFMAALVAGTLAVLFFYLIISRLILQPVRVLQETAEKVSEGDLDTRTHIPTGDEFQALSETFNKMLQNLKQGEDQLRAINKTLDLKLEELAESNLVLYESDRLKSEFLAAVSHELRTPLNSILGFAELLRDAAKPDAKMTRYVQNITSSGKSLLDLINDLLDLAKIEAGKMEIRSERLSLTDLFEGLSSILRPLLEPKGLQITVQIGSDVPLLNTDAAKLQQILYNLLSNAIKFSPQHGEIRLTAQRQGEERVRISVGDMGPGVPADKRHMIFEKFRQIDGSHTRQHSGTGLGLAISRELTHLLGGEIGLDSEPGEGACFHVVLPIKIDSSTQDVRENVRSASKTPVV